MDPLWGLSCEVVAKGGTTRVRGRRSRSRARGGQGAAGPAGAGASRCRACRQRGKVAGTAPGGGRAASERTCELSLECTACWHMCTLELATYNDRERGGERWPHRPSTKEGCSRLRMSPTQNSTCRAWCVRTRSWRVDRCRMMSQLAHPSFSWQQDGATWFSDLCMIYAANMSKSPVLLTH